VDIKFLKINLNLLTQVAYLESHLSQPTDENILETLHGKPPDKTPEDQMEFNSVRVELLEFLRSKEEDVNAALLIHMLDKAIQVAKQGKNVIIDNVPIINDRNRINDKFYGHHSIKLDVGHPNFWIYRDFKIEQQLKYVSVDTLMRNL